MRGGDGELAVMCLSFDISPLSMQMSFNAGQGGRSGPGPGWVEPHESRQLSDSS